MTEPQVGLLERVPPHDLRAERCYLASLLLAEGDALSATPWVTAESFMREPHRLLFDAIRKCRNEHNGHVDLVLLKDWLSRNRQLEAIGGDAFLAEIIDAVPAADHAVAYAAVLGRLHRKRNVIAAATHVLRDAFDDGDLQESGRDMMVKLVDAMSDQQRRDQVMTFGEAVNAAWHGWQEVASGERSPGLMTGFAALDNVFCGLQPGELIIPAGDTGAGKSALLGNILANVCEHGGAGLFVSREMLPVVIGRRFMQAAARVSGRSLRWPKIKEFQEWAGLTAAAAAMQSHRGVIDSRSQTVEEISAAARHWRDQWGRLDVIGVDYIQRLKGSGRSRAEEVSNIVWELKQLALAMQCPVVAPSQLSRAGLGKKDRPTKHELKESGDCENHADIVLLMHLPTPAAKDPNGSLVMEISVPKQRNNEVINWPTRDDPGLTLGWRPWEMRFVDRTGQQASLPSGDVEF